MAARAQGQHLHPLQTALPFFPKGGPNRTRTEHPQYQEAPLLEPRLFVYSASTVYIYIYTLRQMCYCRCIGIYIYIYIYIMAEI